MALSNEEKSCVVDIGEKIYFNGYELYNVEKNVKEKIGGK